MHIKAQEDMQTKGALSLWQNMKKRRSCISHFWRKVTVLGSCGVCLGPEVHHLWLRSRHKLCRSAVHTKLHINVDLSIPISSSFTSFFILILQPNYFFLRQFEQLCFFFLAGKNIQDLYTLFFSLNL